MVFFFMGTLMVMAAAYVQVERLTWEPFVASLPVALLVANILHANNLRDIENDRARGKLTIAGVFGRPVADYVLTGFILGAFGSVLIAAAFGVLPALTLLVMLSTPAAITTFRCLQESDAGRLNALVRGTARLHMRFGLLLALGLALAWI
jgi:1,4-dihydroxy-2-naphthoate octaprenyltransferase